MKKIIFLLLLFSVTVSDAYSQQWYSLNNGLIGTGQYDKVNSICADTIHHILWAGGSFLTNFNGDTLNNLSYWDGINWKPVNFYQGAYIGVGIEVSSLIMFHGKLIMGWNDASSGSSTWNSVTEINVDSLTQNEIDVDTSMDQVLGRFNDDVNALCIYNDTLYAAGRFSAYKNHGIGPWIPMHGIAKWNGSGFEQVGGGISGTVVNALCVWNNQLIACGSFEIAGGIYCKNIAAWNGINWSPLGSGIGTAGEYDAYLNAVCGYNGKLYAGGQMDSSAIIPFNNDLVSWDGINWTQANGYFAGVEMIQNIDSILFVGSGNCLNNITPWGSLAQCIDSNWSIAGHGPMNFTGNFYGEITKWNNDIYLGARFTHIENNEFAGFVARYNPRHLQLSVTVGTNLSCFNNCNGAATTNIVANGIVPFSYEWSNGDTTQIIDNLCTGTYIVTITDSTGMYIRDTIVITQPTQLVVSDTSTNATCPTCGDGVATATISGGTPPYHYIWSNGTTTNSIDSLAVGTYYVTVTDDNNCVAVDTVTVGFDVGVEQLRINNGQLTIYPNPVTSIATIEYQTTQSGKSTVTVENCLGQVVQSFKFQVQSPKVEIDMSNCASGMYFIKCFDGKQQTVIKLVKN